jgi:5-guanidino-2-oxopentanoate decarboxylase
MPAVNGRILDHMPATVGQYIVELLAANGIDTVFGIPGVHNLELYRGLAGSGLRHVLVRHEQNAGFAADGFARRSGRPAAAFVISGPGLSNILTAAAQARSDSVPMLIVASTPVKESLSKGWGVLHELPDQRALAAGAAGLARTAFSATDARDHLREAFAGFQMGRQRPAYLEIPLDLLAAPTQLKAARFMHVGGCVQPAAAAVDQAAGLLRAARRPVVIAGGGARGAARELRELVEKLDAFLITTIAAKGVLPESHAANLGAVLQFAAGRELLAGADVVLAVGTELAETDFYAVDRLEIPGALIRIDIDVSKLADHYAAQIGIWGDSQASVAALLRRELTSSGWRTREPQMAAKLRARIGGEFTASQRAGLGLLEGLRAGLPEEGAVFSDMTQVAYLGNYAFAVERTGCWFHPAGYGTLGYALPAAIGALVAAPGLPAVALCGDFGFQFTLQDLATAVELQLSLPIVLWNNSALGQIRDDMQAAGIALVGVVGRNPDFQALAGAYGAHACRVRTPAELASELRAALRRRAPTLIEAIQDDFAAVRG